MFDAILSGGPGGEAPRESRGVWGAAGPPIPFREVKKKTKNGPGKVRS